MDRETIKRVVMESLKEVLTQDDRDAAEPLEESVHLIGTNAVLDSLGLVRLIVDVEQRLQLNYGMSVTLADERAMSQKHSPFRTPAALIDYICILAEEWHSHARS